MSGLTAVYLPGVYAAVQRLVDAGLLDHSIDGLPWDPTVKLQDQKRISIVYDMTDAGLTWLQKSKVLLRQNSSSAGV